MTDQLETLFSNTLTSQGVPADAAAALAAVFALGAGKPPWEADPGEEAAERAARQLGQVSGKQKAALAELEALVRHVRKGRPPGTWEPRHIPYSVLAIFGGDVEQGVLLEQAAGRAKAILLGEEVVLPKALKWPGWLKDQQLARVYAQRIQDAFARAVAEAAQLIKDTWSGLITPTRQVLTGMIQQLLESRVGAVLRDLWREGWFLGERSALATATGGIVDWGEWQPGDPAAARLLSTGDGLQALLNAHGVSTIKAIADTRMGDLAAAIAQAVADGDSADALARRIEPILQVQSRAQMIAQTEIARAVSAATEETYKQQGVTRVTWEIAPDERVCPECHLNADAGPVPRDSLFPSGDPRPPAHPWCRCSLAPADDWATDVTGVAKRFNPAEPRGPHGEWAHVPVGGGGAFPQNEGKALQDVPALYQRADITPEEQKAIQAWGGPDHARINTALRVPATGQKAPEVPLLDSAIAKSPTARDMTVYRGLTDAPAGMNKPGDVVSDPGFLSASKDAPAGTMFRDYHHVVIHVPAGSHALFIGESPYNEVLLPRNSQLRTDRVETRKLPDGRERKVVYATLLPPSGQKFRWVDLNGQEVHDKPWTAAGGGGFRVVPHDGDGTQVPPGGRPGMEPPRVQVSEPDLILPPAGPAGAAGRGPVRSNAGGPGSLDDFSGRVGHPATEEEDGDDAAYGQTGTGTPFGGAPAGGVAPRPGHGTTQPSEWSPGGANGIPPNGVGKAAWEHELRGPHGRWAFAGSPLPRDDVRHPTFGHGVVVPNPDPDRRRASRFVDVQFDDGSRRSFPRRDASPGEEEGFYNPAGGNDPGHALQPKIRVTSPLTEGERMSRDGYMSEAGNRVYNDDLRHGKPAGDATHDLDSAIGKHILQEPATVYRGFAMPPGMELKPGTRFRDPGYMSSSSDRNIAQEFAHLRATGRSQYLASPMTPAGGTPTVFRIHVPAGHALMPGDSSVREYVLPRGSALHVLSVGADGTVEAAVE